jgi:hypothetical protein
MPVSYIVAPNCCSLPPPAILHPAQAPPGSPGAVAAGAPVPALEVNALGSCPPSLQPRTAVHGCAVPRHATHAAAHMLRYAMLCYAMLCYAMLCYAMPCYAMPCYAMLTGARESGAVASGRTLHPRRVPLRVAPRRNRLYVTSQPLDVTTAAVQAVGRDASVRRPCGDEHLSGIARPRSSCVQARPRHNLTLPPPILAARACRRDHVTCPPPHDAASRHSATHLLTARRRTMQRHSTPAALHDAPMRHPCRVMSPRGSAKTLHGSRLGGGAMRWDAIPGTAHHGQMQPCCS